MIKNTYAFFAIVVCFYLFFSIKTIDLRAGLGLLAVAVAMTAVALFDAEELKRK